MNCCLFKAAWIQVLLRCPYKPTFTFCLNLLPWYPYSERSTLSSISAKFASLFCKSSRKFFFTQLNLKWFLHLFHSFPHLPQCWIHSLYLPKLHCSLIFHDSCALVNVLRMLLTLIANDWLLWGIEFLWEIFVVAPKLMIFVFSNTKYCFQGLKFALWGHLLHW